MNNKKVDKVKKIKIVDKKKVEIISGIIALLFVLFLIFYLVLVGPTRIVNILGVENSYLILFLFAIFGGVSAFTSTTFYATIGAFYVGGLNLFFLALIGAIGLTIGDSFFYYVGRKGHFIIKKTSYKKRIEKIKKMLQEFSSRKVFLFIYIYSGFLFLPKDLLCLILGVSKYPYFKSMVPFFFGNLTFNLIFLYLIHLGFNFGIL